MRKRAVLTFLVIGLILFFLFNIIRDDLFKDRYVEVVLGELEIGSDVKGAIIRTERIFTSNIKGQIERSVDEHTKVRLGMEVLVIKNSEIDNYMSLIQNIDSIIISLTEEGSNLEVQSRYSEINLQMDNLVREMEVNTLSGNISSVDALRNRYYELKNVKQDLILRSNFKKGDLSFLIIERDKLKDLAGKSSWVEYSRLPGVVSFMFDGYESILSPDKIPNLTARYIKSIDIVPKDYRGEDVSVVSPLYKVTDNFSWYIAFPINEELYSLIQGRQRLNVRLDETLMVGSIERLSVDENGDYILVLSFTNHFENFLSKRVVDTKIITDRLYGLIVPTSAIIEKDSVQGVFRKRPDGIIDFVVVEVLGKDGSYSVLGSNGDLKVFDRIDTRGGN